jgi:hypothetical protein
MHAYLKSRTNYPIIGYFYLTPLFFYGYIPDLIVFMKIFVGPCSNFTQRELQRFFAREKAGDLTYNLKKKDV